MKQSKLCAGDTGLPRFARNDEENRLNVIRL